MQPFSIIVTWEDLVALWKKYRVLLRNTGLCAALVGAVFGLVRPVKYTASATFLENGSKNNNLLSYLPNVSNTLNWGAQDVSAQGIMRTRLLSARVVEQLGLQASVRTRSVIQKWLGRVADNLCLALRRPLADPDPFRFRDVVVDTDASLQLGLVFVSAGQFQVKNLEGHILTTAELGTPVVLANARFTLLHVPKDLAIGREYALQIRPTVAALEDLLARLEVRFGKLEKRILEIYYADRDRRLACDITNQIMEAYVAYLHEESQTISERQLAYLENRRNFLIESFNKSLANYAVFLRDAAGTYGFLETQHQTKALLTAQQDALLRIAELDKLEARFQEVQTAIAKCTYFADNILADAQSPATNLPLQNSLYVQFAGIDLATAEELHLDYQALLDQEQAEIEKIRCILPQIEAGELDLHSLEVLRHDTVIAEILSKSTALEAVLFDEENHSERDLVRFRDSIEAKKRFITEHLRQRLRYYEQNARHLRNKLSALHGSMLRLISAEKALDTTQLLHLRSDLATIPERWKKEKELEFTATMNENIMSGIVQMIEGRTIESHLQQFASKPLDRASPSAHPTTPPFFRYMLGVGVLGYFGLYAALLFSGILRGLPLSPSGAKGYGFHCSGALGPHSGSALNGLSVDDLHTLRTLLQFTAERKKILEGTVICVMGEGSHLFVRNLAQLLSMQGERVLVAEASFQGRVPANTSLGLWHYLSGQSDTWMPRAEHGFDWLPAGGTSRFGNELIHRPRFEQFLLEARRRYDTIFLLQCLPIEAIDPRALLRWTDGGIFSFTDEPPSTLFQMGITDVLQQDGNCTCVFQTELLT